MKKVVRRVVLVVLCLLVSVFLVGLSPVQPAANEAKMVLLSKGGEVTSDHRYAGDRVKFKIYYGEATSDQEQTLLITGQLDSNLEDVKVSHNGQYDQTTQKIIWEAKVDKAKKAKENYVEFSAVVKEGAGSIRTSATISKKDQAYSSNNLTNEVVIQIEELPAAEWLPFTDGVEPGQMPLPSMKDELTTGLMINFDIPGMFVDNIDIDGEKYQKLTIPGYGTTAEEGAPALPMLGQIIEVPYGVNFSLEIVKSESILLEDFNICPVQKPEERSGNKENTPYVINPEVYLEGEYYPAELATITAEEIGIMRGHRVIMLKVNPLRYNPASWELEAFSNIEVRVHYDRTAQIQPIPERLISVDYEHLFKETVKNYKFIDFPKDILYPQWLGCDYLILTHSDFYDKSDPNNPINQLKDWKQRKGMKVMVVDTANIDNGTTAEGIREYLQKAYDTWYRVPTYVLLVGDSEFIPTNYMTQHPSGSALIGSDLYYATLDGTDYFPDLFVGRLSVDTLEQCHTVIEKILQYEQHPALYDSYYANLPLVMLFEDSGSDGQENSTFRIVEFAEEIHNYLANNNYQPRRIYDQSGTYSQGPLRYENGTSMPYDLTIAGGFPWDGSTADIMDAINEGCFMAVYDGHGGRDSWARPALTESDIRDMVNGNMTPVVFSWACMTGWFDNETDDYGSYTDSTDESFCEEFLRQPEGGTVGIVGASRISWDHNDYMMLGMAEAIWPEMNPAPPLAHQLPDVQMGSLYKMGQVNTFSKVYMANIYSHSIYRKASFEMYNLLGDPEMPIWTLMPTELKVEFPFYIGSTGKQDFVVKVTDVNGAPVPEAMVVLTQGDLRVATCQTNEGGYARFLLTAPTAGILNMTVTGHNIRPYQDIIRVTAGGADVNILSLGSGYPGGSISIGARNFSGNENVQIYFGDTFLKTVAASSGSFGQVPGSVQFQVPLTGVGPENIILRGMSSQRYAVDVLDVYDGAGIDLYTYSQWSKDTWYLNKSGKNPTWDNPEIQIYNDAGLPVASNNLVVGDKYTIEANIYNNSLFTAKDATITFKWANFGIAQPDKEWQVIDKVVMDVPAGGATATVNWVPPTTGHLCIMVEIYYPGDSKPGNNKGQENCDVSSTGYITNFPFHMWNSTDKPAYVFLELKQLNNNNEILDPNKIWGVWLKHPDPQLMMPGEEREAAVIIDPNYIEGVKPGESAEFALTGYINGVPVGGVNFTVIKK